MKLSNRSGFTLLEIIIVIIIVGVLASLALPRLFATIEYSRSTEALGAITVIRGSMERCYLASGGNYTACKNWGSELDVPNPGLSPNAHFNYGITPDARVGYTIVATRNTLDGGTSTDTITLIQNAATVSRAGTGAFLNLK